MVKISLAFGDNHQAHVRVLQAAKFGTLAAIDTGFICLDHNLVDTGGNQIHLPMKLRDPEAVNDIGGLKLNFHRYSHRNVDFVGSCNSFVWIFNFPPPTPSYNLDLDSGFS